MENIKENKMGIMPIKPLVISMSLPMMVSMLVQALYNVVDSIFVARLSEEALTAVTLAFPLQNLMIAVASGTGVGMNAFLSRALGEKKFDESDSAANTGILLAFLSFILFFIIGIFGSGAFIATQTDDPVITLYGIQYLSVICMFSIGIFFQVCCERLLQSTGKTMYSMITQLSGAFINIIFDPILIFGLFGFPELGVYGAAYATVLGQIIAAITGLILNVKVNTEIRLSFKRILKPEIETVKKIYYVGVPSILMISIGSIMTYLMNLILMGFSSTATAVFGVYFKLQSFFFMPVFGLNNGLIPVLAYNYGAQKGERIKEALKFSLLLAFCIMLAGTVVFETIPEALLLMFDASEEMLGIGIKALRIICVHFPFAALAIVMGSIFQAFSRSYYSLIVSVARQLLVLIPAAWLLARLGGLDSIWWSFLTAETVSLLVSVFFFKKLYTETVKTMR